MYLYFFYFLNSLLHTCNCIFPNNLLWWKSHAEEFKVSVEVGCMFACFWVQLFSLESVWVGAVTGLQGGDRSPRYGLSSTVQLFFLLLSILVNLWALAKERWQTSTVGSFIGGVNGKASFARLCFLFLLCCMCRNRRLHRLCELILSIADLGYFCCC